MEPPKMNTSYFNAIAGAFLAVVFVVMTVSIASDAIFHTREPVQEGFEIEVAEGGGEAGGQEDAGPFQIATLMAGASVDDGANVFKKCQSCHTVEDGGANKVGPNLWHVLGRPVASAADFAYSPALVEYAAGGETHWLYQNLSEFLDNPKRYISGTKMSFAGLKKPEDRANVIAYLRTLSPDPLPLPTPEPEAADAETTPEATEASATPEAASDAGAAADTSGSTEMTPAETTEEKAEESKTLDEAAAEGTDAVTTDVDALEEEAAEPTATETESSN